MRLRMTATAGGLVVLLAAACGGGGRGSGDAGGGGDDGHRGGDEEPPTAPTGVVVTPTTTDALTMNVSWAASSDNVAVTGYQVYRGEVLVADQTTTSTTDRDPTLQAGVEYCYSVTARDAAGNVSAPSDPGCASSPLPRLRWSLALGAAVYYSSPALGADGTIYVGNGSPFSPGSATRGLFAVSPDGVERWRYVTAVNMYSPALGADGTIYVQDGAGTLHAVAPDGTSRWTHYLATPDATVGCTAPAIGADGTIVAVAGNVIAALDASGAERWRFAASIDTGGPLVLVELRSSPAIATDGTIVAGYHSNVGGAGLWAWNQDGTEKWRLSLSGGPTAIFSSPAIGADGTIYVGAESPTDGWVIAVSAAGVEQWRHATPGHPIRSSPTIAPDGTIYVGEKAGTGSGALLALHPDGTERWTYSVNASAADVYASPTIGSDGTVYFGAETSRVYALDPGGALLWSVDTVTGGVNWTSAPIASDGMLYVGNNDGGLFAIQSDSVGLATSPWPRYRHDDAGTGRAIP